VPLVLGLLEQRQTQVGVLVHLGEIRLALPDRKYWPQPRSTGFNARMQSLRLWTPMAAFQTLLGIGSRLPPTTYEEVKNPSLGFRS
jgi:hypothetical protein